MAADIEACLRGQGVAASALPALPRSSGSADRRAVARAVVAALATNLPGMEDYMVELGEHLARLGVLLQKLEDRARSLPNAPVAAATECRREIGRFAACAAGLQSEVGQLRRALEALAPRATGPRARDELDGLTARAAELSDEADLVATKAATLRALADGQVGPR